MQPLAGALLLPTLNYGMSAHHTGFAGTATLSPRYSLAAIKYICVSSCLRDLCSKLLFTLHHQEAARLTYASPRFINSYLILCSAIFRSHCVPLLLLLHSTYAAVISDIVTSFKRTGFSHILLLNGHGGNIAPGKWGLANGQAMANVSSYITNYRWKYMVILSIYTLGHDNHCCHHKRL
jgi:creatinine amidohydrolase/Fe(II)-dependent formamide hydrolase-like protein